MNEADIRAGANRRPAWGVFAVLAAAMAAIAALQLVAYRPGLMTWDAIRQYGQAIDGDFDDWHPPAMEWLWRQLIPLHAGPLPMLLLQTGLFWGGLALIAARAAYDGRRGRAIAIAACGLLPLPLALFGAVLKDCLMAGALLAAAGLLGWIGDGVDRRRGWALRLVAVLLLLYAATLRFNAFLACLPIFVMLWPAAWRRTSARLAMVTLTSGVLLVAAMPLANRAIGAEKSGVELSLIIFDLGGITYHSGVDAFPPLAVADSVAVNRGCYSPVKWDPYSWWVDEPCPIGFELVRKTFAARHENGYGWWLREIVAHPFAYAAHRLAHFDINARFLTSLTDMQERPVQRVSAPNPWGYRERTGNPLAAIDRAAVASAHTPIGWPIFWIAVAAGVLLLPRAPRSLAPPLALSALLYGAGYGVFSVAAELRYHLWTMIAALLAAVIGIADLRTGVVASRCAITTAAAVPAMVTIAGLIARLAA